jgi:D-3-phosphoglycerate dehydrogenase
VKNVAIKIAMAEGTLPNFKDLEAELIGKVEFVVGPVDTSAQVEELTAGAEGLVVGLHLLDAPRIAALDLSVKVIGRSGVGLDAIDLDAARRCGVAVVNEPSYAAAEVATHAVAMLLALQRRLPQADAAVRSGWGSILDVGPITWALEEAPVGVLGCGSIGREVVQRLVPFVKEVRVLDPILNNGVPGARVVANLGELLDNLGALTLHLPLNEGTRHIIGRSEIRRMRPGSILVNVSRGGLVDEDELALALGDGHLAGAGLDVFEHEPLPESSSLRSAPNLLMSPHVAWYSDAALKRLGEWTVADVVSYATEGKVTYGRLAVAPAGPRAAVQERGSRAASVPSRWEVEV